MCLHRCSSSEMAEGGNVSQEVRKTRRQEDGSELQKLQVMMMMMMMMMLLLLLVVVVVVVVAGVVVVVVGVGCGWGDDYLTVIVFIIITWFITRTADISSCQTRNIPSIFQPQPHRAPRSCSRTASATCLLAAHHASRPS